MTIKLPRSLIVSLAVAGTLLLGISVYLENDRLSLLLAHPILANLLSGATGFCWASVFVTTVINWYATNASAYDRWRRYRSLRATLSVDIEFFQTNLGLIKAGPIEGRAINPYVCLDMSRISTVISVEIPLLLKLAGRWDERDWRASYLTLVASAENVIAPDQQPITMSSGHDPVRLQEVSMVLSRMESFVSAVDNVEPSKMHGT